MDRTIRLIGLLLLGLAVSLLPRPARAGTYLLPAQQDSWVEEFLPDRNHGADPELRIVENGGGDQRSVLQFDLSSVPVAETVTRAYLRIRATYADRSGLPVNIHRITDPWSESTANWNNVGNSYDKSTIYGSFIPLSVGTWNVDITSLMEEWHRGVHPNHGLMLIATSLNRVSRYSSRESLGNQPMLVVTTGSGGTSDLALAKVVDDAYPDEGETIAYRIMLRNLGPDPATGVTVADFLPSGVTYQADSLSQGSYERSTGLWTVGSVASGDTAMLVLKVSVDPGTRGSVITNTASVARLDQADPVLGNNTAAVDISVRARQFRLVTGSYGGNGQPFQAITDVGFRPDLVIVRGDHSEGSVARTSTMAGDASKELGTSAPLASNLIASLDGNGFTVGSDIRVNSLGVTYYWIAAEGAPDGMVVGSYEGDGGDNRQINGIGFEPAYVIVMSEEGHDAMQRYRAEVFDKSLLFQHSNEKADRIQDFLPDGFELGKHDTVNKEEVAYHYVAWSSGSNQVASDGYPGDGADNRDVTQVGFQPEYAIITRKADGTGAVQRPAALALDNTLQVDSGSGPFADGIQQFVTRGFQVGQHDAVNKSGEDYFWIAFLDASGTLDLATTTTVDEANPIQGATIRYAVTVTNRGKAGGTGIELKDVLPSGVTYASHETSQGNYTSGTGLWAIGNLAQWASATLNLTATVDIGTGGSIITNTATVTAVDQPDIDATNDSGSATITVQEYMSRPEPVFELDPGPIPASITLGDSIDFSMSVLNAGGDSDRGRLRVSFPDLTDPADVELVSKVGGSIGDQPGYLERAPGSSIPDSTCESITAQYLLATYLDDDWTGGETNSLALRVVPREIGQFRIQVYCVMHITGSSPCDVLNGVPSNGGRCTDQQGWSSACYTVTVNPPETDLALTKTVDVSTPNEGDPVAYTITLTNNGPTEANGIEVTDPLPGGVTYVSDAPTQGSYASGTGIWTAGTLANGASATLILRATVDPGTGGTTITNTAAITAADRTDPLVGNNSDSVDIAVRGADLAVAKSVDNPTPIEGSTVTFSITLLNGGPGDATGVEITDLLPAGVTFQSALASQGTYDDGTGVWAVGDVAFGNGASLNLVTIVDAGTVGSTITNTASITAASPADPEPSNNTDSAAITVHNAESRIATGSYSGNGSMSQSITGLGFRPDLVLVKGDRDEYAMARSSTMAFNSSKPLGADGGIVGNQIKSLDADGFTVGSSAYVNASGTEYFWTAFQKALGQMVVGSYPGDGSDNRDVNGLGFQPTYVIVMGEGATQVVHRYPAQSGDASLDFEYGPESPDRIQVFNPDGFQIGSDPTVNTAGTDYHYAAWRNVPGKLASGSYTGNGFDNRSILGLGFQPEYVLVKCEDVVASNLQRPAAMTGDNTIRFYWGPRFSDAIQTLLPDGFQVGSDLRVNNPGRLYYWIAFRDAPALDVSVVKMVDSPTPNEGDTITYTITVTNSGPEDATGVEVLDQLPAGVTYVSDAASQGAYASASGIWTVGSLVNGATATLTLTATVDASTGGSTITNTATLSAIDQTDSVSGNNTDSADIDVQSADLTVTKTVSDETPNEGDPIAYTVVLHSNGPNLATGIEVTDVLPAGVTYVSATPGQGSYASGTGLWTVGDLVNDGDITLVLNATVDAGTAGSTITNTAAVTGADQADPNPTNNSDTADITVQLADLAATKTVDNRIPNEGDTIEYTIILTNEGPDPATGVELTDLLPEGVSYVSAAPGQGAYASGTGVWTVGDLGNSASATLVLTATVDAGAGGSTITNTAVVTGADQADPSPANNSDTADITVQLADLAVTKTVGDPAPNEGDPITYTITLANNGPNDATSIELTDRLPDGVTYVSALASRGTYESASGLWSVTRLASGASATLVLAAEVDAGTGGSTITNTAAITAVDQADPEGLNNSDDAGITVRIPVVDLAVIKSVDNRIPIEGDRIEYTIHLTNNGPGAATGIEVTDQLPAGVTYVSASASQGTYASGSGLWAAGNLVSGGDATLVLTATVDPGTAGSTIANTATVTRVDQGDPNSSNNTRTAIIDVQEPPSRSIAVNGMQSSRSMLPGDTVSEVFRLELINSTASAETLTAVVLHNRTSGPGTQTELDEDWQEIELAGRVTAGLPGQLGGPEPVRLRSARFAGGEARFSNLSVAIAPGDTAELVFQSGASLTARDGDLLDLSVDSPLDLVFTRTVDLTDPWPVAPSGSFPVDGMAAAQISLAPVATPSFLTGSTRNLALDFVVPANGYQADVLERVNVVNVGTAVAGTDIVLMEAWVDDGDGGFDPVLDRPLGTMTFTGNRWEITGVAEAVPVTGLRLFVSCDLDELATEGRTIQLALPAAPEDALGMESTNDGPLDEPAVNDFAQSLSAADRMVLTANPIAPRTVRPGESGLALLHLIVSNTYSTARTLESVHVVNRTTGAGSPAELDGNLRVISLREDGNGDGRLGTLLEDPLIGSTFFQDGEATFTGLSWLLPGGESGHLFVTAEIALLEAADGDVVSIQLPGAESVSFDVTTSVVASWPLDSGARLSIDGMVAEQITNMGAPVATLGPDEGPALVLDLLIPRNGYASDILEGLVLANLGTASATDLAEVRLWKDGGNGAFDAGATDDLDLGEMSWATDSWRSSVLSVPLAEAGSRFFVSATASTSPTDSATVRLTVPLGGITVASGNDGPVDISVANPEQLLLSTSALLTTLELHPSASIIGQTVIASLSVRNVGGAPITDASPSALTLAGSGVLELLSGPAPASTNLAPGETGVFVWTFESMLAGEVRLSGSVSGIEAGSGQPRHSLTAESNIHRIFREARDIGLFPVESMPFAINRGQTDVVPISLTFTNEGGDEESDVKILALRFRIEGEGGAGIIPADLLSRVVVNEGTNVYLEKTSLETVGAIVELSLVRPIVIEAGGEAGSQVTVSFSLDISGTTTVPDFRLAIADSTWVTAIDATSGGPVQVVLEEGGYPIVSGLARIVTEATQLAVDMVPEELRTAGRGQEDLELLTLDLLNPDPAGLASDVRVVSFRVSLIDSMGGVLPDPELILSHIEVRDPLQRFVNRAVTADDDSALVLDLSPLLSVPVNSPVSLTVACDISSSAPLTTFRTRLAGPGTFDARDANSGNPVLVIYAPDPEPVQGGLITIEAPAESLVAQGTANLPPILTVGKAGISAMTVGLAHPGGAGTGSIRCDNLTFRVTDQAGSPLIPANYLDRVAILRDQTVVGQVTDLSLTGNAFTVPISSCLLRPGEGTSLEVRIDFEASAPTTYFSMSVGEDAIDVVDVNLGVPVNVIIGGAQGLLTSGLTQLVVPPSALTVAFADSMPPVLAPGGNGVIVCGLTLTNRAGATSAAIDVDRLAMKAADRESAEVPVGRAMAGVEAYVDGVLWADSGPLSPEDATAVLGAAEPLVVEPGGPVEVAFRVHLREGGGVPALRVGFDSDGIGVIQPESPLLSIAIQPAEGQVFPMWTQVGNFTVQSLAESYSNFPNPFAAGRDETNFVFYLPRSGRVSLQVWTLRGEKVRVLREDAPFPAGLHQGEVWDGRNGRGDVVLNGVYLAELRVAFDDGSSERHLRKVAVVR